MTISNSHLLTSSERQQIISQIQTIVGTNNLLTAARLTKPFRQGYRFGNGPCLAVIQPNNLWELWQIVEICCQARIAIIMQAANTGLTGGSTPDGDDYDRELVIINTLHMTGLHLLNNGEQVICFPGTTLYQLEQALLPLKREPHSIIGSSCLGASVFGGICNNSGGALVQRGPAYTELALYAQVNTEGQLELINHLGIDLGQTPHQILSHLTQGDFTDADIHNSSALASDHDYAQYVRQINEPTPARFNADSRRLFEASGSAGKIVVFAVRLDTFAQAQNPQVFYLGTNDPKSFTHLRRTLLAPENPLPIAAEYMHRDCFDIAAKYGKDVFLLLRWFGTARMPLFNRFKNWLDRCSEKFHFLPRYLSDQFGQLLARLTPMHLPQRLLNYRNQYEHHLILKIDERHAALTEQLLDQFFNQHEGNYFLCSHEEGEKAFLHRFAAAGAAIRYQHLHANLTAGLIALDIALPRNMVDWFEQLPKEIDNQLVKKLYCGHFLCHVLHQDYIVKKGYDPLTIEQAMWLELDKRQAKYPAEHNVGHLYPASTNQTAFYQKLDPHNYFNPGIGQTSKVIDWQ